MQEPVAFFSRLPSISADKVFHKHCLSLLQRKRFWEAHKLLSFVMLHSPGPEAVQYYEVFARHLSCNPPSWERRMVELAGTAEYLKILATETTTANEQLSESFSKFTQAIIAMETLLNIFFEDNTGYRGIHEHKMHDAIRLLLANASGLANTSISREMLQTLEKTTTEYVILPTELRKLIGETCTSASALSASSAESKTAPGHTTSHAKASNPVEETSLLEIFPFEYQPPPLYTRYDLASSKVLGQPQHSISGLPGPAAKPYPSTAVMSTDRIVIGIDLGTTYSGVAWAQASEKIEVMQNWPTTGQLISAKVPTEIAYSTDSGGTVSWGYTTNPRHRKARHSFLRQ